MGKQQAAAAEGPKPDSPEVLAWAEAKGLRIGPGGLDSGHFEAYLEEQARKAN